MISIVFMGNIPACVWENYSSMKHLSRKYTHIILINREWVSFTCHLGTQNTQHLIYLPYRTVVAIWFWYGHAAEVRPWCSLFIPIHLNSFSNPYIAHAMTRYSSHVCVWGYSMSPDTHPSIVKDFHDQETGKPEHLITCQTYPSPKVVMQWCQIQRFPSIINVKLWHKTSLCILPCINIGLVIHLCMLLYLL